MELFIFKEKRTLSMKLFLAAQKWGEVFFLCIKYAIQVEDAL